MISSFKINITENHIYSSMDEYYIILNHFYWKCLKLLSSNCYFFPMYVKRWNLHSILFFTFKAGHFIENNEIDPTKTEHSIRCLPDGVYQLSATWPNCTQTVSCGPPINPPENGTITWIHGVMNDDIYNTTVRKKIFLK